MPLEKSLDSQDNVFSGYVKTRDHYYENMMETFSKGEYRKASEFLWGAVTQSIKALAVLPPSPKEIRRHDEFFDFTKGVSKETRDKEYHELFLDLNALHRNFYDEIIPEDSFLIYLEKAKNFLKKTQNLIDEKLRQYGA